MPRSLLKHEKKIIEEMLADSGLPQLSSAHTFRIPETVDRVYMDDDEAINAGSMIIFRQQKGTKNCNVISCSSLFPRTVVGELYLTSDEFSGQLAFLELIAWPQMPRQPVEFLAGFARKFCREKLCGLAGEALVKALDDIQWFSTTRSRRTRQAGSILNRLRIAYIGTSVCFMFSETLSFFVHGGHPLCSIDSPNGSVQVLSSPVGELAIDGWCDLSKEEWEEFADVEVTCRG